MKTAVSIIIVTYNSARHIEACLHSALVDSRNVPLEVIVIDNASTDDTATLVHQRFPGVKVINTGRNLGFAAGVNTAARTASGEFLLLLNPDTVLLGGAINQILTFARENPHHGLYGGRSLKPDGSLEPSSCWGLPTWWSLALFATGLTTLAPRNRWLNPEGLGSWARDSVREVGVVTGCFLLVHHEVWESLRGFDERYFMYGEDVDLAMRARAAGYRPAICPDALLLHEVGQSSATPAAKMSLLFRGKACLIRTHWRGLARPIGLTCLLTGVGLRAFGEQLIDRLIISSKAKTQVRRWTSVWQSRREWLSGYPDRPKLVDASGLTSASSQMTSAS